MSNGRVLMLVQKRGGAPPYFQFPSIFWSLTLFTNPALAFCFNIFYILDFHLQYSTLLVMFGSGQQLVLNLILVFKQKQKALPSEDYCTCAQIESGCSCTYVCMIMYVHTIRIHAACWFLLVCGNHIIDGQVHTIRFAK